jgi:hypothetical protein
VKEHPTGAEDVEVTVLDGRYPETLLRSQMDELGRRLGTPPRGLIVYRDDVAPEISFLKATFAVTGLIDRPRGILHLEPIVQAFAGAPAPFTVNGLDVLFENETPNTHTVKAWQGDSAEVEALFQQGAVPMIEYRVKLLTQDRDKISIPSEPTAEAPKVEPPQPKSHSDVLMIVLIAVAALAVGALVYSVLLKRSLKPSR